MKINKILLLVLCMGLSACSNSETSPSDTTESDESQAISETDSNESVESEESIESVESVESIESVESTPSDTEPFSLKCEDFPEPIAGGYPPEGSYDMAGNSFYIYNMMQNTGKYEGTNTIQMKKEGAYFYNENPIYGLTLSITIMKNVVEYNNTIMHTAPTVYASDSTTFSTETITVTEEELSDRMVYTYSGTEEYTHFKVVNESSYAQYIFEVAFAK